MLKNEHRISGLHALVIIRWRVNNCATPLAGRFREVPLYSHLSMRDLFDLVVINAGLRNFDAARFPAVSKVRLASQIVHLDSVQDEPVVMKTGNRGRRGHAPDSIRTPGHRKWPFPESVATSHFNAVSVRRLQREGYSPVRENPRALRTTHIGCRRRRAILSLCSESQHRQHNDSNLRDPFDIHGCASKGACGRFPVGLIKDAHQTLQSGSHGRDTLCFRIVIETLGFLAFHWSHNAPDVPERIPQFA
jgi:hypothetical protein